jgi:hypothetical protein
VQYGVLLSHRMRTTVRFMLRHWNTPRPALHGAKALQDYISLTKLQSDSS